MDWISWLVLVAGVGFSAGFVVWAICRVIQAHRDDWQRELTAAREQRELAEESRRLREQIIDQLEQQLATAERRADEYRKLIEVVQRERNGWQDLYFSMAAGNASAQDMLMREIERVTLHFRRETGKPLPVTPSAEVVRSAYLEAHGGAAQEYRHDQGAARKAAKAEEEARAVQRIEQASPE